MLDLQIFNVIHYLAGKSRFFDAVGINLASAFGYILIGVALYAVARDKDWQARYQNIFFIVLSLIVSRGILTELIRFFYNRPRPFTALNFEPLIPHDSGFSFPSGHAVFYFTLACAMWHIDRKWAKWIFGGAALLSVARIFAGVHWPLDVFGAAAIAWISVFCVRKLLASTNEKKT